MDMVVFIRDAFRQTSADVANEVAVVLDLGVKTRWSLAGGRGGGVSGLAKSLRG